MSVSSTFISLRVTFYIQMCNFRPHLFLYESHFIFKCVCFVQIYFFVSHILYSNVPVSSTFISSRVTFYIQMCQFRKKKFFPSHILYSNVPVSSSPQLCHYSTYTGCTTRRLCWSLIYGEAMYQQGRLAHSFSPM